ncbi:hypothetical protein DSO57_1006670 [Entomophthora muscae]|uniref:Uncharacterized protein n=2 Tax=Entomophthora muscae TaxID=34485 RepID=A0ACC2SWH2_9FUNG|nr:hypothetical protein DSO57_1006670 [Entomophthora muscae]
MLIPESETSILLPGTFEPLQGSHENDTISSARVFSHNEVNLQYISVYGFDYDYTLANYTEELPKTIYSMIRDSLIDRMHYPKALSDFSFDPNFAVRGLHYDVLTGWLMKVDAYHSIQLNTVYYGREALSDTNQVLELHNGTHISPSYMKENLIQLNDLFSVPEICLIADIIQFFYENDVTFHPRHLYDDVRAMGELIHSQANHHPLGVGPLHLEILTDVERFLNRSPSTTTYLNGLHQSKKKVFLMTNSGYPFVNKGLSYVLDAPDWRDLFDVTIVKSGKPSFYTSNKPFRRILPEHRASLQLTGKAGSVLQEGIELDMSAVSEFKRGEVYQGGNLGDFSRFTGWWGQKVLYIGDHIYSDLVDPTVQQGWRTGAIVSELDQEIARSNSPKANAQLSWMLQLEQLLRIATVNLNPSEKEKLDVLIASWRNERRQLRNHLKQVHNQQFGSVFRTHHNPTYFAKKIRTFADLYTSKLENLANYPLDFVFYPERSHLPHEKSGMFPEMFY